MTNIIGIDEVGRGSAMADLVVCGVRAPQNWHLMGLADSKQLSHQKRETLNNELLRLANEQQISYVIVSYNNQEIDTIGLGLCLKQSYCKIINQLYQTNDEVILDGNLSPHHLKSCGLNIDYSLIKSIIKADTKISSVMAASIIAKEYRDNLIINKYHQLFPQYGWDTNMGYLTKAHVQAIKKYGLTPLHRHSYNIKL